MSLKRKSYIFILFMLMNLLYSSIPENNSANQSKYKFTEDGLVLISVNVWGHVKYPGTYLVYDGIDILTCLSMAGGPLKGSNLSKVSIVSKEGLSKKINLKDILDDNNISSINLKPYDTIYIDETFNHFIFSSSNVITIFLQIAILVVNISK